MDFSNQRAPQHSSAARTNGSAPVASGGGTKKGGAWRTTPMWLKIIWVILLFSTTVLAVAMVSLLAVGGPREQKYIQDDKIQAVFMTNGQVYFGDLKNVNDEYLDLQNIYYLSVKQAVQPKEGEQQNASISLIKLGCELHGPVDQMIINRDQVTFWENLKDDGQVTQAIDKWVEQNPDGQKCSTDTATSNSADQKSE
jgi:hypothetical protein